MKPSVFKHSKVPYYFNNSKKKLQGKIWNFKRLQKRIKSVKFYEQDRQTIKTVKKYQQDYEHVQKYTRVYKKFKVEPQKFESWQYCMNNELFGPLTHIFKNSYASVAFNEMNWNFKTATGQRTHLFQETIATPNFL